MLIRIFTQNTRGLLLTYPFVAFGVLYLFTIAFPTHSPIVSAQYASEYWIPNWLHHTTSVVFLGGLMISLISWQLNLLFNNHELYFQPSYLVGLLSAIILSVVFARFPQWSWLMNQLLLAVGFNWTIQIFRQKRVFSAVFIGQLLVSTAICIYPQNTGLLLMIPAALMVNRPFDLKENAMAWVAAFTPFGYWLAWSYYYNQLDYWHFWSTFSTSFPFSKYLVSPLFWFSIVVSIFSLFSLFQKENRQTTKTQQAKNTLLILAMTTLISMVIAIMTQQPYTLFNFAIPFILISGYYWTHYRVSLLAPFLFYSWIIGLLLFAFNLIQ